MPGHFPNHPVTPGLGCWAVHSWEGTCLTFLSPQTLSSSQQGMEERLEACVFKGRHIQPEDQLHWECSWGPPTQPHRFQCGLRPPELWTDHSFQQPRHGQSMTRKHFKCSGPGNSMEHSLKELQAVKDVLKTRCAPWRGIERSQALFQGTFLSSGFLGGYHRSPLFVLQSVRLVFLSPLF